MMEHLIGQQSLSKEQYLLIAKEECPANPVFKPEEIKEGMKDGGSLYQHCQEVLDFCYNEGMIDSKPDPASFINNELYLEALDAYYE
jgi:hypothetical protein